MYFVPNHPSKDDAEIKYKKLKESLDNYISGGLFKDWTTPIEDIFSDNDNIENALQRNILIKTTQEIIDAQPPFLKQKTLFAKCRKTGLLESNFDPKLRKILIEVYYWTKVA
jgi:hypothetical protein